MGVVLPRSHNSSVVVGSSTPHVKDVAEVPLTHIDTSNAAGDDRGAKEDVA